MNNELLNIKDIIQAAWGNYKRLWVFCSGTFFLAWLSVFIPGLISVYLGVNHPIAQGVVRVIQAFLHVWVFLGFTSICILVMKNKTVSVSILYSQGRKLWKFIIAYIIYSLILLVGFMLLIVPGVIWSIQYSMYYLYIVEKNMQPVEALQASSAATYGHKWYLASLFSIVLLINIAGLLCFIVGLLVTVPLSMLMLAEIYRRLSANTQQQQLDFRNQIV